MKPIRLALAAALVLSGASSALVARTTPARVPAAASAWDSAVSVSPDGFPLWGNPAAPVKLVEYISYTCSHCADFSAESYAELASGLVRRGKVSVELRPFLRNSIDAIPSLIVMCGSGKQAFAHSKAVLAAQPTWFRPPADPTYEARWKALDSNPVALRQQVAKDMGFYALFEAQGIPKARIDLCLAKEPELQRLIKATDDAVGVVGVQGTPSFTINGRLQDVYGWAPLKPLLEQAVAQASVSTAMR